MSNEMDENAEQHPESFVSQLAYAFAIIVLQSQLNDVQNNENDLIGDDMITLSQRDAIKGLLDMLAQGFQIPPIALFEVRNGTVVDLEQEGLYQPIITEHCRLVQSITYQDKDGRIVTGSERCRKEQCFMAGLDHTNKQGKTREFAEYCYTGMYNEAIFIRDRGQVRAVFLMGQMRIEDENAEYVARKHASGMQQVHVAPGSLAAEAIRAARAELPSVTREQLRDLRQKLQQIGSLLFEMSNEHEVLQYYAQLSNTILTKQLHIALEALQAATTKNLPPEEAMQQVREAKSMLESLQHLLAMIRQVTSDYRFEPVRITDLITTCKDFFQGQAQERDIQINLQNHRSYASQPTIDVSHAHFICALQTLLDNAIKYSFKGSQRNKRTVEISVDFDDIRHMCAITIENYGYGITQEEIKQQYIFQAMYRGEAIRALKRQPPGKGLGLAVALEIINVHHGKIAVESTTPGNREVQKDGITPAVTKFTIQIPYKHQR